MGYNFSTIDGLFRPNYNVYNSSSNGANLKLEVSQSDNLEDIYLNLNRIRNVVSALDTSTNTEDSIKNELILGHSPELVSSELYDDQDNSYDAGSNLVDVWTSVYKDKKDQWIIDMVEAYRREGLPDNAIRNLLAKNALESGWGKSAQGAYNFGNIITGKYWNGKYAKGKDYDGNGNIITNYFRAYNSLNDYVRDELQFLTRLYDFDPNDDIDIFIHKLQGGNKGGRSYAESKSYKNALKNVYRNVKI